MLLYGSYSFGMRDRKELEILLEAPIKYFRFPYGYEKVTAYLAWGYKPAGFRSKLYAQKHNKPCYVVEDGFLRSLYSSKASKTPLSIVFDKKGAYFDASIVTDLEELLVKKIVTSEQKKEAREAIDFFTKNRLSKYCITTPPPTSNFDTHLLKSAIVLIDQTLGDASLEYGGVSQENIPSIVEDILANNKDKKIFLKTHPDVIFGKSESCFSSLIQNERITKIPNDIALIDIFNQKPQIIALTSLAGFEALLHGCEVTCYGLPWYCGYGLTLDKHNDAKIVAQRRKPLSLEEIFYLAYMVYPLYLDPNTLQKGNFWDVAYYLSRCIKHIEKLSGTIYAFGFRPWKQKDVLPFFKTPFNQVLYVKNAEQAIENKAILDNKNAKILVWSYKNQEDIDIIKSHNPNIPILRCEDGFIRSYGLGSDFIKPYSLAIDKNELYFYHSQDNPSEIQALLKEKSLPYIQEQVKNLHNAIIANSINKYNLEVIKSLPIKTTKRKILAIGQVDGDASLKYGTDNNAIALSNQYLLDYAKSTYPDDFIIYKPHPDVISGNRGGMIKNPYDYCDYYAAEESVLSCIESSDIVITMTSLSGFEALIREKKLDILGHPFYKNIAMDITDEKLLDFIRSVFIDYPIYRNKSFLDLPYGTAFQTIEAILQDKYSWKNNIIVKYKLIKRFYQLKKWILG